MMIGGNRLSILESGQGKDINGRFFNESLINNPLSAISIKLKYRKVCYFLIKSFRIGYADSKRELMIFN